MSDEENKTELVIDPHTGRAVGHRLLSPVPLVDNRPTAPRTAGELQAFIRSTQQRWPEDRVGWFRVLDILHVGLEHYRRAEEKIERLESRSVGVTEPTEPEESETP